MRPVKRKTYMTVLLSAAAAAIVLSAVLPVLTRDIGKNQVDGSEHPLRISEIMSNNVSVPNGDGLCCDWIEIENTSSHPFNVSGYRLTDDITEAKYAFPVGTVIPAGGFIVVWCDPDASGSFYAPFSLSARGGETIELMNSSNTVLDSVETLRSKAGTTLIRCDDGTLTVTAYPTPGYANTEEGYAAWLNADYADVQGVRLCEIMTVGKNELSPEGFACDWIEIENTGDETADLSGMHLSDKPGVVKYTFPEGTVLEPGGRLVVWCSKKGTGSEYAPFAMNKKGETVILTDRDGNVLDQVRTPGLTKTTSYARIGGLWEICDTPTPGYPNTAAGYQAYTASLPAEGG